MDDNQFSEILERLEMKLETISSRQGATSKAIRSLVEATSAIEDDLVSRIDELIATTGRAALNRVTAEDLANLVPNNVICKARNIQWARKRGEPEPLPEPPNELVPRHNGSGGGRRREDDSLAIKTNRRGETRIQANLPIKQMAQWIVATVAFGLGLWHMIAEHAEKKIPHSTQPPPSIAAPP